MDEATLAALQRQHDEWTCKSTHTVAANTPYEHALRCILKAGHTGEHYCGGISSGIEWTDEAEGDKTRQQREREADEDNTTGRYKEYDSMDDFIADLNKEGGE